MKYLLLIFTTLIQGSLAFTGGPSSRTYYKTSLYASAASATKSFSANTYTDDELVSMTKAYIDTPSVDTWSEDFVFRGPVIGPLAKVDLKDTLTSVSPADAFTEYELNAFNFGVDPVEKNRVWFMVRPRGVFSKPYMHPTMGEIAPTGELMIAPPETRSLIWNDDGKLDYTSIGYVADRFTGDTTGGMGAIFGMFKHMGIEIDGTVGSPSMRLIMWLGSRVLPEGSNFPKSYSNEEDIPSWWTDKRRGADP